MNERAFDAGHRHTHTHDDEMEKSFMKVYVHLTPWENLENERCDVKSSQSGLSEIHIYTCIAMYMTFCTLCV